MPDFCIVILPFINFGVKIFFFIWEKVSTNHTVSTFNITFLVFIILILIKHNL